MSTFPPNLSSLFLDGNDPDLPAESIVHGDSTEFHARIEGLPGITWKAVGDTLSNALESALDVGLDDILARAWSTLEELQEYLDPDRHPPEEVALVPLLEHSVHSHHEPAVELLAGDRVIGRLTFEVELQLTLEGIALKIQAGKILGAASGTCQGVGVLRFRNQELAKKSTPAVAIPGFIAFENGFEIPRIPSQ